MPITYREKLKIFHDTFIKYVCFYIERQKIMDHGFDVPSVTNNFKEKLEPIKVVPLLNVAALALDLWNSRDQYAQITNIKKLFSIEDRQLKLFLSDGIKEVAINFESVLDETKDIHKIGLFASKAAKKFLNNFQVNNEFNAKTVSTTILKQYSLLTSRGGDLFAAPPPNESKNYCFIFEADLLEYINFPKTPHITLSLFLRKKYNLQPEIQIVLRGETSEETRLQLDLSYLNLNGYEFDTEIFKLDILESSLQRIQAAKLVETSTPKANSLSTRLKKIYSLQDTLPKLINDDALPAQKIDDYHVKLELKDNSKSIPIDPAQMFKADSQDQTVEKILLIAGSGMGKTSFVKSITYKWGKHGLFDNKFTYLFKIDLQLFFGDWSEDYSKEDIRNNILKCFVDYLIRQEIQSVDDQLAPEDQIKTTEIFNILDNKNQDKIVLIVDNYGTISHLISQSTRLRSLINQLFQFKYMVVTTKPNALNSITEEKFDRKIESVGFNGKGTIEYVNRFFANQQQNIDKVIIKHFQRNNDQTLLSYLASKKDKRNHQIHLQLKKINLYKNIESLEDEESIRVIIREYYYQARDELIQLIRDNIHIRELTTSPLALTILCLVTSEYSDLARFKANFNIITLYQEFILWLGKRYIIRNKKLSITSEDISLDRVLSLNEFNILQQIAYESLETDKLVISGRFVDKHTHATQSVTIREIYNFGLLKTEYHAASHSLIDQIYLFIHPNLQQFLVAKLLLDKLASDNDKISRSTANFIAHHRNEPKYLMTLKFMVGLIQAQDSLVAIKFWDAIVCNVDGFLELGTEYKATLLMHLLKQAGLDKNTKYFITHKEAIENFIDKAVMKDDESFLRWGDKIKNTGYLSSSMLEYILTTIRTVTPQQSQHLIEWEESEKSELDNSPPIINSCFIFQPPLLTIKKNFIDILYNLVAKFAHYQLYNNKMVFYTLKPYLSDSLSDWQTIELVIKTITNLIKVNGEYYLEPDETKELLTESTALVGNKNLKNSAIILIKTIIQTANDQNIINFSISLIRNKLSDNIAIEIISRLTDSYNNLAKTTFELLMFNIRTSNYIDCCLAMEAIGKLPSVVCDPDNFIKIIIKKISLLIEDNEPFNDEREFINYRLMQTIQQIVLDNMLESSTSSFIKEIIEPLSKHPKKPTASYVAATIISELEQPKTVLTNDKPDYTLYHRMPLNPLETISSSSYDCQHTSQINFIDLSLESLSNLLRHYDPDTRFPAAKKLNDILSSSAIELKSIILSNLKTLLSNASEKENSGIIYAIAQISSNNEKLTNDGLGILTPLLTSDNYRTLYSSVFAIAKISQKVKIPQEISTLVLDKLLSLLEKDHSSLTYNIILAIGNIAVSAIDHNHRSIIIILDKLIAFVNPVQSHLQLSMSSLVRHQTYSHYQTFKLSTILDLQQSPESSTKKPNPISQPLIEISANPIDQTPDIEDIVPCISCYKNSLSKVTMYSLVRIVKERNYKANKMILRELIYLAEHSELSQESSYIITKIINLLPLNQAARYLMAPSQQIHQITIKAITIRLRGELENDEWSDQIENLLNIIGAKILEEELKLHLHESAKKYLTRIIHNIDNQKLEWLNNNFERLVKLSSHTPHMMTEVYHFVLRDRIISQEISNFILNCITILGFTFTISKSSSEPKFTIFCTESYIFYGEENLQYLETIARVAIEQSDNLLAQQYTKNTPIFHNTGSAIRISACDIQEIQSIVTYRRLTVDMWEVTMLDSITDKILLLERRNFFGEHEIYKIRLQGADLATIKFTYHPNDIRDLIQKIYGGIQYRKSEITIDKLEIESGYRILSLVNTSPQIIINLINSNDFSPITDSESPLTDSPKICREASDLEDYSDHSSKKHKINHNNEAITNSDSDSSNPLKKYKTASGRGIETLSSYSSNYKRNPDTDSDVFMLHHITYDNPPPIYSTDKELSQFSKKTKPETKHEHHQSTPIYNGNLFLLSLTFKNLIEEAPIIKYFWKNMLQIPLIELPDVINNDLFWITTHYVTCQTGLFSITGQTQWQTCLPATVPYTMRLLTYNFLAEQKQSELLNSEDRYIKNSQDFVEKCWFDISMQTALGLSYTTPLLPAGLGGLNCYYLHNQESIDDLSGQETIIPYITSIYAGYLTISSLRFDFNTETEILLSIDGTFTTIRSMVVVHDITTLLLLTTQELRAPAYDFIINTVGDLYDYYFNNGENYE
ncbi:MAG: NACHT domain-containing protein [Rickettsiales bacterium]|nr:NACHT domain-containing protein [Rickettsiales bacterium]